MFFPKKYGNPYQTSAKPAYSLPHEPAPLPVMSQHPALLHCVLDLSVTFSEQLFIEVQMIYCHLRQDLRMFRLDRVRQAELLQETFTRPPDFDCLDFLRRSIASMPGTWKVEVLLEMSWEEAERQVPPTMAMLEQVQGGVMLSGYTQELSWMAHFLVSLRCPLVVREPPELQDALRRLAAEIAQLAQRSG